MSDLDAIEARLDKRQSGYPDGYLTWQEKEANEDLTALIARVRELETALAFYGNPLDYEEYRPPNYSRRSAMEGDLGYTARKALGALNEGDIEYEAQWGGDK